MLQPYGSTFRVAPLERTTTLPSLVDRLGHAGGLRLNSAILVRSRWISPTTAQPKHCALYGPDTSTQLSIRILRRSLDLSLNQLAHMAGIRPSALSRLELGTGAARHEAHVRAVLARAETELQIAGRSDWLPSRTPSARGPGIPAVGTTACASRASNSALP